VKSNKTRAEIQRAYRERLKEKGAEAAEKERRRWHARRQLKKVKVIADLSEKEKRAVRRKWRTTKAEYRRIQKNKESSTPPASGRTSPVGGQRGRPKVPYRRRRAYMMISKLNAALGSAEAKSHKYKMRWLRLKHASHKRTNHCEQYDNSTPKVSSQNANTPSKSTPRSKTRYQLRHVTTPLVKKSLLFHNVMAEQSEKARKSCVSQKVPYSVPQQILKKYRLANFARKVGYTVSASTKVNKQLGRGHANALDDATKDLVQEFFERDDNSRLTSGKKQTVTKNKIKKQKRLLLDTVVNLHEKFCSEYTSNCISYPTFARLRPFWVRLPTSKDRDTCMCKKHTNVQLLTDKLFQLGIVGFKNCEDVLEQICCDVNEKACMMRECDACRGREIDFKESTAKDDHLVIWSEWTTCKHEYQKDGETKSTKLTAKCVKHGTLKELKALFDHTVRTEFSKHVYTLRHQFRAYRSLKETLQSNECVIHIDFSENYECKYGSEIQSAHFGASKRQITIHTGVVYRKDGHKSFASISDSLRHDPAAIWAHMKPVLLELRQLHPQVTDVHFFSDGPTPQYRNKQNFYLLSTQIYKLGFRGATWNFLASGHGKGAPDAIGGAVKRQADAMVSMGCDINDAENLFKCLQKTDSVIRFYSIMPTEVVSVDSECSKSLKPLVGTMKIHQLYVDVESNVSHRTLSCFCSRPGVCSCYNMRHSTFSVEAQLQDADSDDCCEPDGVIVAESSSVDVGDNSEVTTASCASIRRPDAVTTSTATVQSHGDDNSSMPGAFSAQASTPTNMSLSTKSFYSRATRKTDDQFEPRSKRLKRVPTRYQ